ncbi:hypothetical protein DMENIID0001_127770 [Sergentomyia squamirostris]
MLSEPTRSCSGTCIDHVFLRSFTDKYTCSCGTIDLNVSDHKLVTILLSGPSDLTPKPREDAQDTIRKINFDHLRRDLLEEGWVGVYTATNSSVMFQSFIDRLRTLVDKNTRVVSFSREYIPRNPWVSYDLCRELRIKNNIIALSRRRPGDLCLKRRAGRVARSMRHKITLAREEYFVQKFRESVGNPKKQWGTVNRILGKRRKDRQITELMIDDVIINDVGEIAESLNDFFVNVPVALSNQITRYVNPGAHLAKNAVGSIFLSPVSGSERFVSMLLFGVLISTIPVRRSGGWLVFASLKSLSTHGYCRLHGVRILWVMLGRGWCDMVALEDWMRIILVGCRVKQSVLVVSSWLGDRGETGHDECSMPIHHFP